MLIVKICGRGCGAAVLLKRDIVYLSNLTWLLLGVEVSHETTCFSRSLLLTIYVRIYLVKILCTFDCCNGGLNRLRLEFNIFI